MKLTNVQKAKYKKAIKKFLSSNISKFLSSSFLLALGVFTGFVIRSSREYSSIPGRVQAAEQAISICSEQQDTNSENISEIQGDIRSIKESDETRDKQLDKIAKELHDIYILHIQDE